MARRVINPWNWQEEQGWAWGAEVSGPCRILHTAAQGPFDAEGRLLHAGDVRGQTAATLDNLETVLAAADMSLASLVRLNVYTTDVDGLFAHYGVLASRLGAARVAPTTTMLEVTRLAIPGQLVELEGTAVD